MKIRSIARLALIASAAAVTPAMAEEQISLSISGSRSAEPVGNPTVVTSVGGTVAPAGSPITIFSAKNYILDLPFFAVRPGALSAVPTNLYPPTSGIVPVPAQSAASYGATVSFASSEDVSKFLSDGAANDFKQFDALDIQQDDCFRRKDSNAIFGLPANTSYNRCDALDINLTLNGVAMRLTAAENNPDVTLTIPSIGVNFLANNYATPQFNNRSASFSLVSDYLQTSGKGVELAKSLTGDAGFTRGTLPQGGTRVFGSFKFVRSTAVAANPLLGQVALPAGNVEKSFGFTSFSQFAGYVFGNLGATTSDFGMGTYEYNDGCFRSITGGNSILGRCDGVDISFGLFGVAAYLKSAENSTDITLTIPDINYTFTSQGAADRDSAISSLQDAFTKSERDQLLTRLAAAVMASRPDDPLIGNPDSLQGKFTRLSLDIENPSVLLDEVQNISQRKDNITVDSAGWMVGGRIGTISTQNRDSTFVETLVERSFRVGEGNRSRLKVSVPFSLIDYGEGDPQSTGSLRVSYETPLKEGKWIVEPAASIGYVFETDQLAAGALYQIGVSSRYKIAPVGRGHLVLGTSFNYSSTIEVETRNFTTPVVANTIFRNAIAYQVPVGQRIFGRLGTLRASYAYTAIEGDKVFLDKYHDVSFSYGVGAREATTRQIAELFRIGFSGTFGDDYDSYSVNVGFRF